MTKERYWKIPVIWSMWGIMKIPAKTLEEAIEKAKGEHPLPEGDYIDGSCQVDVDSDYFFEAVNLQDKLNTLPKKVKIVKVSDENAWYKDHIGEVFEVLDIWEDAEDHYLLNYYGEEFDEEAIIKEYGSLDNPDIPMEFLPVEHGVRIKDCEVVQE